MDVGRLLREARACAGVSQGELAARAGVDASVLCRFETGVRVPTFAALDALLGACGYELAGQLVPRSDALHEQLALLAATPLELRLADLDGSPPLLLRALLEHGCDPVVGGGWSALALGLPVPRPQEGLLLLRAGDAERYVAAVQSLWAGLPARRWVDGEPARWPVTVDLFAAGTRHRWSHHRVGEYWTVVLQDAEPGPVEERLELEGLPLRVVAAVALGPEDGVPVVLREAFLRWRAQPAT